MVYVKQIWVDDDPLYPVSAVRLSHIEDGIEEVSQAVDQLARSNAPSRAYPLQDIVVLGHSHAAAMAPRLATHASVDVHNAGIGSQDVQRIAARFNAPSANTQSMVTIPANGSEVTVTLDVNPVRDGVQYDRAGSLAGIEGVLKQRGSTISFAPAFPPGANIPVASGTPFIAAEGEQYRDRTAVLWMGGSNDAPGTEAIVMNRYSQVIDRLNASFKRFVILQPITALDANSTQKAFNALLDTLYKTTYPQAYIPVFDYIRSDQAFTDAGITKTSQDIADIAAGGPPVSFRAAGDTLHLNALGYGLVARYAYAVMYSRGWVPAPLPDGLDLNRLSSDTFTGGDAALINGRATDVGLGGSPLTWVTSALSGDYGTVAISGGKLVRGSNAGASFSGFASQAADTAISIKFAALPNAAGASMSIRRTALAGGSSSRYQITLGSNGSAQLAKAISGTVTTLGDSTILSPGAVVTLYAKGDTVGMMIDGVIHTQVTDTSISAGGYVGFTTPGSGGTFTIDHVLVDQVL